MTRPQDHLRVWDSSNISESFPGLVMPLTFSIAKRGYQLAYKAQAYSAGLSWYDIEARHRTFDSMIAIFNGRLYYNLRSWYDFISLFPGSRDNQQFLDDQIATQGNSVRQSSAPKPLGFKLKFGLRVAYRGVFFSREQNEFYRRFARFERDLAKLPAGGDFLSLLDRYAFIEQTIVPHFGRTVDNDFFVMLYHGWIKRLLRHSGTDTERTNLLGAMKGVASAEQAAALYELAAHLRQDPQALRWLQQSDFHSLHQHLSPALKSQVEHYINTFGHRFAGDQKIEAPNPTLEPAGVYRLMRPYVLLDPAGLQSRQSQATREAARIEQAVSDQLPLTTRPIYRLLLGRLKHHLRLREKNRLLRGKTYGYLRELFPKVGQALVGEGLLTDPADIFYLEIEELYALAQGGGLTANDLPSRIKSRRAAYERYAGISMPIRFNTTGIPTPEDFEPPATQPDKSLPGLVSSPGDVTGRVVVLDAPRIPDEPFDILVTSHTDPGWTPLIALAKGVIVEHGGMLSHAAIVTRELGIPSLIGVENATQVLKTGMTVRLNPHNSCVQILD